MTCSSTTSRYSYPWKWWHTAKWGWKAPTHFDYLAILKTFFLWCGGAPLLQDFKPDYISHKYRRNHLKVFCNRPAISVEELPLSHQKYAPAAISAAASLLPRSSNTKGLFSASPTTQDSGIRCVHFSSLLLPHWWRKLETVWSSNLKLILETKFIQPSLTIPQITLKNAWHFCGLYTANSIPRCLPCMQCIMIYHVGTWTQILHGLKLWKHSKKSNTT